MHLRWIAAAVVMATALGCGGGDDTGTADTGALDAAVGDTGSPVDTGSPTDTGTEPPADSGADAAGDSGSPDPCMSTCGTTELCDGTPGLGLDDDCDDSVDEGCSCTPGTAQACFRGDPALRGAPGCFAGRQLCGSDGTWETCTGGFHASEGCATSPTTGCHAISTVPFATADLTDGTGTFGMGAVAESWTVGCPAGVSPCPVPSGSDFTPLVSGEYTVTYTKTTSAGTDSCTFPLFIGTRGLRTELSWEWDASLGRDTVDLDLHLHKPADTTPWGGNGGNSTDCAWTNCTASDFTPGFPDPDAPDWFMGAAAPDPVDWYLDPMYEANTCYFAPRGAGTQWQSIGQGCHNPRLDADNVSCDPSQSDPQHSDFCNAENANIDYPPLGQWTRLAVHYYSNHGESYDVHPVLKVYCDARLVAELGPTGYDAPITFTPADGSSSASSVFWLVADVAYVEDACGNRGCVVQPLYSNPTTRAPVRMTATGATSSFGPAYPPVPSP